MRLYILNLIDPASFLIQKILSLHWSLKKTPSDPVADDIPMCHHASLVTQLITIIRGWYLGEKLLYTLR